MAEPIVTEEWRPVVGWESSHMVSNFGQVRSKKRVLSQSLVNEGRYKKVVLVQQHRRKTFQVQWLVLAAFVGPRPKGMQCCHNDGNGHNNCLNNLRWDTPKANHADRYIHGTILFGQRNVNSRLSDMSVQRIRQLLESESAAKIAKRFGVSDSAILHIKNGNTWTHVI